MINSRVFDDTLQAYLDGYRYIVNKGGTRSSKTWNVLELQNLITQLSPKQIVTSTVAITLPHLRKGALRDFIKQRVADNSFRNIGFNKQELSFCYGKADSVLEFFSTDSEKAHGAGRDNLFINECQLLNWDIARHLLARTSGTVFLDYNPIKSFWIDKEILEHPERSKRTKLITSTYRDNNFLTVEQVAEIEANKDDARWWQVYGEGQTGNIKSGFEFYSNFSFARTVRKCEINREATVHVSFDFNVSPYITATVWQVSKDGNRYVASCIKEFCLRNPYNKTFDLAATIRNWLKDNFPDPLIRIYGDASGSRQSTISRYNEYDVIAKELQPYMDNRSMNIARSNPRLKGRRTFMNKILGGKHPYLIMYIDPKCKETIADFENVVECPEGGKLKQRVKDADTGLSYEPHGHTSDSADYFFCELFKQFYAM